MSKVNRSKKAKSKSWNIVDIVRGDVQNVTPYKTKKAAKEAQKGTPQTWIRPAK